MSTSLFLLNGPNLNFLGRRNQKIYGSLSYEDLVQQLTDWCQSKAIHLEAFQSNSEGTLIDKLQGASKSCNGIVFNPGALAHTSIALRDCIEDISIPVVEVHITNIGRREHFRRHSYLSEVASASIMGFGCQGYFLALELVYREVTLK